MHQFKIIRHVPSFNLEFNPRVKLPRTLALRPLQIRRGEQITIDRSRSKETSSPRNTEVFLFRQKRGLSQSKYTISKPKLLKVQFLQSSPRHHSVKKILNEFNNSRSGKTQWNRFGKKCCGGRCEECSYRQSIQRLINRQLGENSEVRNFPKLQALIRNRVLH